MKCNQQCYTSQRQRRLRAARASSQAHQTGASMAPSVLSGTWDFKWPSGTNLRVAFQRLPVDLRGFDVPFETAQALVLNKLDQWLGGADGIEAVNLTYEVTAPLPPPPLHPDSSPRRAKSETRFSGFVEYDVLVSFLPLPVLLPATEQHPQEVLSASVSELGRYAHRIEYGVPTIYLGPQPGMIASQWFSSADGIFTVVHELGHLLGLPHEQQNPRLPKLRWRPLPEMLEILELRDGDMLGDNLEEVLRAEIIEPWPGELAFSDWRQPPQTIDSGLSSVMARPLYRCLLDGGHPGFDCRTLKRCPHEEQALQQLQGPTPGDLSHLLAMYGARNP